MLSYLQHSKVALQSLKVTFIHFTAAVQGLFIENFFEYREASQSVEPAVSASRSGVQD